MISDDRNISRYINEPDPVVDPAQLSVFRALTEAILDEMGEALGHGAFSQNIKERRDYSCALFDSTGNLISGAAHIPVHIGSMDTACKSAIKAIKLSPGDAVLLNDPYSGGTHLPDLTVILPAFLSDTDKPDFFLGVRAHHSDVGGIAPGSLPMSKNLAEEGIVIPPTLILKNGEVVEDLVTTLASASRQPRERTGDLRAQLASASVGLKRLNELAHSRGLEKIHNESRALMIHSSRIVKSLLASSTPGVGEGSCIMDPATDEPGAIIQCKLTLSHSPKPNLEIDFTQSSDLHPGCLNAVPAIVRSSVLYCLRLFLPPDTPTTSGLLDPINLILRPGSILDPIPSADSPVFSPAVAGGNVETSQAITEALLIAFGDLGWNAPASSQGTMNNVLLGNIGNVLLGNIDNSGYPGFSFYETIGGGSGGSRNKRGESGIQTHMTNTRNTPIESLEREYPIRIRSYHLRDGSGGAGLNPGGDGIVREYEILAPTRCTILSGHRTSNPPGASGGYPGQSGKNELIRNCETKILDGRAMLDLQPGDILRISTPGGGAWGKPR
jgi:N-methylhydantoinase B